MVTAITLEEGLDYILSHLEGQRLWPRAISTKTTEGRQVVVNSIEQALARFAQANFLDCRISAYPPPSVVSSFVGVNLNIAPSFVMIDLDRETFKTQRALEMALSRTLKKILRIKISEPTVIWSGNGYHIYLVLDAFVLETEDAFNNSKFGSNPSQKFLRFAEWFLSIGKCDPQHNKTVSFKNCMLRVPGSVNSKNGQTVRIIQRWNGYRPNIKLLLEDFYVYLSGQRLVELEEKRSRNSVKPELRKQFPKGGSNIHWIERLLQTPISDYRKLAMWRILIPYLMNIRGLSSDEAQGIIHDWLEQCGKLRGLDFTPSYKIKGALNGSRNFLPVSCNKLKIENKGFYNLLQDNGVLTQ
jgi:Primase X